MAFFFGGKRVYSTQVARDIPHSGLDRPGYRFWLVEAVALFHRTRMTGGMPGLQADMNFEKTSPQKEHDKLKWVSVTSIHKFDGSLARSLKMHHHPSIQNAFIPASIRNYRYHVTAPSNNRASLFDHCENHFPPLLLQAETSPPRHCSPFAIQKRNRQLRPRRARFQRLEVRERVRFRVPACSW